MVSACWFDILLVHNSTGEFCVWLKALSNDSNTEMTLNSNLHHRDIARLDV